MKPLISDSLCESMCRQIAEEMENSNIYLFISSFLKNKGLSNLAAHFEKQYHEEAEHAKMFVDYLTDVNAPVFIYEVPSAGFAITNPIDIVQKYLDREILTTQSIAEIKLQSDDEGDFVLTEFLRGMISKQQHEYSEALDMYDKFELCSNDWFKILLLDLGMK